MSNVVPGPKHDGPKPTFTGGRHPRGHDQAPAKGRNPGHGDSPAVHDVGRTAAERRGYTKLDDSPSQDDRQTYPGRYGAVDRKNKGIDIDFDRDGSYTGGTGNGRAD